MAFVLVQISDTHVTDQPRADGARPAETLAAALAKAARLRPDAVLVTGDLVDAGGAGEYAILRGVLEKAPAPVFLLPGNHDDPDTLRACFPEQPFPKSGRLSYVVEDFPVRLVCVDQHRPGSAMGRFTVEDADWLDGALMTSRRPAIVALHHPPFATFDPVFDGIGLDGADRLARVVSRYARVERVVCGHFHRAALSRFAGTVACIAPSTAWSFDLALGGVEHGAKAETIGFAVHVWDGAAMTTHFEWL